MRRTNLESLAPLYSDRTTLRAVVDAVLEGSLGAARADSPARPRVARLDVGCYAVFGGDAAAPGATALVRSVVRPRELVFPDRDDWRRLLHDTFADLAPRPMCSYAVDFLDPEYLRKLSADVPAGFSIEPIDAALASRLGPEHEPHGMQVFGNADDFARRGLGYCALADGVIACAATSYTVARGSLELAIATHPEFRRRGLARAVAARLMVHALERGVVPHWNAANPVSQRLAVTLGYRPADVVEILWLAPRAPA